MAKDPKKAPGAASSPGVGDGSQAEPILGSATAAVVAQAEKDITEVLRNMGRRLGGGEDRLRDLAHEIRTPMSALIAYTDLLRRADQSNLDGEKIADYAGVVHEAALRILSTTERVLDEHVTGDRGGRVDDIDFGEFAAVIMKTFAAQASSNGVTLDTDIAADFPRLAVDRIALDRVMTNLIANALKFTPAGGRVVITAKRDSSDNAMVIVISDTGRGFPADVLLKVERGETISSGDGPKSWGRGLNTVRELLGDMGADLEIENVEDGAGALAVIRFPPPPN